MSISSQELSRSQAEASSLRTVSGREREGWSVVEATDSVRLTDTYSALSSAAWASGDAGSITLSTPDLLIENEADIYGDAFGDGRGGDVLIAPVN